jgi:hypothetical protein
MRSWKLLLAATMATMLLGTLTATATGRSLELSSTTLRVQFRAVTFEGIFGQITCQMTLEGSLHSRTITKTTGTLIGYITAANLGTCGIGTATIFRERLPWHIRYGGFTGTLPRIETIRTNVIGFAWRFRTNTGETCTTTSTATNPLVITYNVEAGGAIPGSTLGGTIPTESECFRANATFRSDVGVTTVLNSTTRITVRLI